MYSSNSKFEYESEKDCGGIREAHLYEIEDTEKTFKEWRKLQNDFITEFEGFTAEDYKDYEMPEWHYEMRCLWVNLHNDKFYDDRFVSRIKRILEKNGNCFAQFECYNSRMDYIGHFQVYKDKVYFDETCEESGLIKKLCGEL